MRPITPNLRRALLGRAFCTRNSGVIFTGLVRVGSHRTRLAERTHKATLSVTVFLTILDYSTFISQSQVFFSLARDKEYCPKTALEICSLLPLEKAPRFGV